MEARLTPTQTREFADVHLSYELEMAAALTERMLRTRSFLELDPRPTGELADHVYDVAGRNADVESFGIHARSLTDFFYGGTKRDVKARDFFDDPEGWRKVRPKKAKILDEINSRVAVEVAHLRPERSSPSKSWFFVEIWDALASVLEVFLEHASAARLDPEFTERAFAVLAGAPRYQQNAGGAVGTTSADPSELWTPNVLPAGGVTATYAPDLYTPPGPD